jgi:hypothetical protein
VAEFSYPDLSRAPELAEFERVLRLGLGRAVLWLQRHDPAPYRDIILNAVLHDWTFDKSFEHTRERYLLDIVALSDEPVFFREQILRAVSAESGCEVAEEGDRSCRQVVAIARLLAQEGDDEARQIVRDAFARAPFAFQDAREIVKLDGVDGLIFAADHLGRGLLGEDVELDWTQLHLTWALDNKDDGPGLTSLVSYAESLPGVAAYLGALKHYRASQPDPNERSRVREEIEALGYDDFVFLLPRRSRAYPTTGAIHRRRWGKKASDEDFVRAARDLIALPAADTWLISCYLDVFEERAFPLDPQFLIDLVRRGNVHGPRPQLGDDPPRFNDWLAWQATIVLESVTHPDVRRLGLELLRHSRWTSAGAKLLVSNYEPGDLDLLETTFLAEADPEERHAIGMTVMEIGDKHHPPEIKRLLIALFDHGPCAYCRFSAVRDLEELADVPHWMVEEGRFDSLDETRQQFAATTLG